MKRGKKYLEAVKAFDKAQQYDVAEAIEIVKKNAILLKTESVFTPIKTPRSTASICLSFLKRASYTKTKASAE